MAASLTSIRLDKKLADKAAKVLGGEDAHGGRAPGSGGDRETPAI